MWASFKYLGVIPVSYTHLLPGETVAYNSKTRINQYLKHGYELVHDGFANANDKRFDSEKQTDQVF